MDPQKSSTNPSRTQKRRVVLWGTPHSLQRGDKKVPSEQLEAFRAQVRRLALENQVLAIAEEMNLESMQRMNAQKNLPGLIGTPAEIENAIQEYIRVNLQGIPLSSIPEQVAQILGLPHAHCDPNSEERRARNIKDWDFYGFDGFPDPDGRWRAETFPPREEFWIERLLEFDRWPVLYLCGKDHFEGFPQRLEGHGFEVVKLNDENQSFGIDDSSSTGP